LYSYTDENAGDIPDHDGDESREADDAKENGHDGKKDEAKADCKCNAAVFVYYL